MKSCRVCEVELDDAMEHCPICGIPAGAEAQGQRGPLEIPGPELNGALQSNEKTLLQRIVWQVTTVVLLSAMASTLIIDLVVNSRMTWSVFPVSVSLVLFSYVTVFSFWHAQKMFLVLAGLLIASVLIAGLDWLLPDSDWLLQLGLPMLAAANFIGIALVAVIGVSKHRGLNVLAFIGVAVAILCISIEAILSIYYGMFVLHWSVVVSACLLPAIVALLFVHYRIKRNPALERHFHT